MGHIYTLKLNIVLYIEERKCNEMNMQEEVEKMTDIPTTTLVIKIGGSCLTNGKTIKTIVVKISQLKERGVTPAIVISALKGMTDTLLELAVHSQSQQDPRAIDKILSEGERLSIKIIHSALQSAGIKARAIFPSNPDFPIITDDIHCNANVMLEETEKSIMNVLTPLIKRGIIPIIPGFIGKTKHGTITTMGRGNSDTTAILVGKALKAQEVILLKDVPGILSGDPKIVNSPKKLSTINVEEALDLGMKGGKVLCPISLKYKPKGCRIRIVNFDNDDLFQGGTEIIGELGDKMKVKIDEEKKVAVTVIGNKMSEIPGLLAKFSEGLSEKKINIFSVSASNFSICFYVDMRQHKKTLNVLHDIVLRNERLTAVTSMPNISLITIAGKDFVTRPGVLGRIGMALAKKDVNIVDISTSICEADIFVDSNDAEKAKQVLEGLF